MLQQCSHPHLLPYIGGNVPLNYYLKHNFNAPAPIPSNDIDIKVEFGEHMRAMLAEKVAENAANENIMSEDKGFLKIEPEASATRAPSRPPPEQTRALLAVVASAARLPAVAASIPRQETGLPARQIPRTREGEGRALILICSFTF